MLEETEIKVVTKVWKKEKIINSNYETKQKNFGSLIIEPKNQFLEYWKLKEKR